MALLNSLSLLSAPCTQLAEVHTDQVQLVCKHNTGSFEEKSIRFPKEANIAQDECRRRGPLMNTGKENFNSGYGSNINLCLLCTDKLMF